jgi:hypothetical protein
MAAEVTVATGFPYRNVNGNWVELLYKVSTASTTDYLTLPIRTVRSFSFGPSAAATAPAGTLAVVSASDGRMRLTLACSATDSALYIRVTGH